MRANFANSTKRRAGPIGLAAGGIVIAGLLGAIFWSQVEGAEGGDDKPSSAGIVACARIIADGVVHDVSHRGGGAHVTLSVQRSLKPKPGLREVEFEIPDGESDDFTHGQKVLVSVSRFNDEPILYYVTEAERNDAWEWMSAALREAGSVKCSGQT